MRAALLIVLVAGCAAQPVPSKKRQESGTK
jgi:hypothetical protein